MKVLRMWILLGACLAILAGPAAGQTIKLGSLAPEGSPWDNTLKKIAAEWGRLSGGMIQVRIYPGGIAGNEQDAIRKMRIRQLDAAALTGIGISLIIPNFLAVQLPMFIQTDQELDYVLQKMKPVFEQELEEKGFKLVLWTMAGWAHLFGRQPVVYPDDLRKQKLHVQPENSEEIQAWKSMGFQVVPLPITDVLSGLQSGLTDAYAMTPLTAASLQWFALTPNMSSMNWGPMLGGIVVSQTTWRRIPDDLKPRLLEVASAQEQALRRDTDRLEQEALAVMKQYGLKIQPVPPDAVRQWQAIVDRGFDFLIGKTIDRQVYQQIEQHLEEFRGR
jgi:TRAP-type C4-dicarboxylate transport system substrate-binding protein